MNLLTAIITERRICFMASDADKLTACVHASLSLVYPFVWQHPLIPVLSPPVAPYANSNSPIIFGIRLAETHSCLRRGLDHMQLQPEYVCKTQVTSSSPSIISC